MNKDQFSRATVKDLENDPYLTSNGTEPLILYIYDDENDIEEQPKVDNLKTKITSTKNKNASE
jgi:hypothetical protein